MLGELFYWLLNMSISALITMLVIALIRKIKRIPRRVVFFLWAIPMIRMWCPVGIGSPYGLMAWLSKFTTRTVPVYEAEEVTVITMTNHTMGANSYFPITYKIDLLEDVFKISSMIWLAVAVALIIIYGIFYSVTIREFKHATHLRDRVYLSEKITSPMVCGVFRPKIILPLSYAEKDLTFVLLHENAHIKRADNLWRILAFVSVAVHWFNPFAWVFLRYFLEDMECACDETVLVKCGESQKKAYALSLVGFAESKIPFISASAFGGSKIRVRIANILSYKKLSALSAIGLISLTVAIAYALLTNAL